MKRLITFILLLAPLLANAITIVACAPKFKLNPNTIEGSALRTAKSDIGRWVGWWCGGPDPANPTTRWIWKLQRYSVLTKYGKPLEDAITASGGDAETLAVFNAVINLPQVTPAPGTQEEYEFKVLQWSACKSLTTKPYDPQGLDDLPATFCGTAPAPPPPPVPVADVYVASTNGGQPTRQTFAATQVAGVWKRGAVDGTVDVGTVLDCTAIQILELGGLARYCKVPGKNSVTGATLKKP